jgi:hypothetical protein
MKKLFLSSFTLTTFAFSIAIFQLSSCKKEDTASTTTPAKYPIEGLWIGTYSFDGQPTLGQQYFSFVIKPDGTMITDTKLSNQQYLALGNWSLTSSTLTCAFTYIYGPAPGVGTAQTASATWDNTGKLTGTWQNVSPANGVKGTFILTRVN